MIHEFKQYVPVRGKAAAQRARPLATEMPIFERLGNHVMSVFAPQEPQGSSGTSCA